MNQTIHLRQLLASLAILLILTCQNTLARQTETAETAGQKQATPVDLTELEWVTMTPSAARAKFEMPTKPRYVERKFTPVQGIAPIKVKLYLSSPDKGLSSFIFSYHDLHDRPRGKQGIRNTLEGAVRGSIANVTGQILSETQEIKFKNAPGRQFVYGFQQTDGKKFVVISRVYLRNRRLYQLSAVAESTVFEEATAGLFLNSFDFVRPRSDLPPIPTLKN
jgi:hypothetical protein